MMYANVLSLSANALQLPPPKSVGKACQLADDPIQLSDSEQWAFPLQNAGWHIFLGEGNGRAMAWSKNEEIVFFSLLLPPHCYGCDRNESLDRENSVKDSRIALLSSTTC
jgi:hypothetical protein